MKKNNVLIKFDKEKVILEFLTLDTYDDFDSINKFLKKYYGAKDLEILNGPDMRIAYLVMSNIKFELYNDPYSNLLTTNEDGKGIIEKIARDIDTRLQ